jgi:hypothetical protein
MTTKATRKRKPRAIAEESSTKVTASMRKNAATFHRENAEMNRRKKQADTARKALYSEMKAAGVKTFDVVTTVGKKQVSLEATVEAKTTTYIDTEILSGIVTKEQFEKIVTAAKGKVEEVAGKDVAVRASKTKTGTENVTVKTKK